LAKEGLTIKGITDDLLLAGYLLDSTVSSNPELVYSAFGVDVSVAQEEAVSLFETAHPKKTGKMAYYALALKDKVKHSLQSVDAYELYSKVELPLMFVLSKMELEGFPLNKNELAEFGKVFSEKKDADQAEIYQLAGEQFNLNSPQANRRCPLYEDGP
jgi:DNA polymerase-1